MWFYRFSGMALLVLVVAGCGKPPMQEVQGTLTLNGKPIGNCKVGFFPDTEKFDTNRHGFGFGVTNDKGEFKIQHPQGEQGIWAGKYKVTLVAWIDQSGKSLGIDTKPSEVSGGVRNLFPDIYEAPSTTPERAVVKRGENTFNFDIVTDSKSASKSASK
jgi:hypothetical protein